MAGFDDLLNSALWSQNLNKSLGLSSQLSEIIKAQSQITKSLGGLGMMTEIAKSMKQQAMFAQPTLSAIDAMTKSMNRHSSFAIPKTTLDAITSINKQHQQLFGGIKAISEVFKNHSPALAQINNLQFALSGISGQVASLAAQQRNWKLIDDFEEITEQAIEFSETLSEEITQEQQRQFQVLVSLILTFINKHKQKGINAFRALEVILVFYQVYSLISPGPAIAGKEDVKQIDIKQDTVLHYIQLVNEQLRQANEYRITNRISEVKLKPKLTARTLTKLPTKVEVIVIQTYHKWIYVSYFDPKDNLPQTGWIMKKYLDKP